MIKKITFITIIASVLVSTLSCQKSTELMVVGKWLIDHVGAPSDRRGAYWEFDASGGVTFFFNPEGEKNGFCKGDWKVKKAMLRRYIEIKVTETYGEIDGNSDLTGSWRVDFLNNRKMGLVRVACPTCPTEGESYIRRDFTKMK
ncbi:MAG: hypothetical protein FWC39_10030 [Bacteroidetes bacterium]|nr:hypothetical protein [Bacteroidota bacterium]